ncbi:MAG: class I SAM-dependent methyltransferase [Actinomycetota bacterium]|nr:class I SAM-dependent methyltransferase [Actinomycetota bacterium]
MAQSLAAPGLVSYRIDAQAIRFLASCLIPDMATLETGAGSSTVVFALAGTRHTVVTPNAEEFPRIRAYAEGLGADTANITFVPNSSDWYLPTVGTTDDLDLVLIDGKHAFPWPVIDWFYTAGRLRVGGVLLLDDVQLRAVRVVADFLDADDHWVREQSTVENLAVYRKTRDGVFDVAWGMQPWGQDPAALQPADAAPEWFVRLRQRARRAVKGR